MTAASFTLCAGWSNDVYACPGPVCTPGEVFPTAGTVPANHFQLAWQRLEGTLLDQDRLRVFRVSDEQADAALPPTSDGGSDAGLAPGQLQLQIAGDATALVTSAETLVEGDVLRVDYAAGVCDDPDNDRVINRTGLVTLGSVAELPTDLGALQVETGEGYVDLRIGMCEERTWLAYAVLDVQLSESARPFADLFMYDVEVNGELMPREFADQALLSARDVWPSVLGGRNAYEDKVLLTADCTSGPDDEHAEEVTPLTAGTHTVSLVATLPDGTRVASDALSVTLACKVAVCQQPDYPWLDDPCTESDGGGIRDGGGISSDAGSGNTGPSTPSESGDAATTVHDSSPPRETTEYVDAALAVDASTADAGYGPVMADEASGCRCTLGVATSKRQPIAWAGLLLGLLLWKRQQTAELRAAARS